MLTTLLYRVIYIYIYIYPHITIYISRSGLLCVYLYRIYIYRAQIHRYMYILCTYQFEPPFPTRSYCWFFFGFFLRDSLKIIEPGCTVICSVPYLYIYQIKSHPVFTFGKLLNGPRLWKWSFL